MTDNKYKADNKENLSAEMWFLGRLLEIDAALLYPQIKRHALDNMPAVCDIEVMSDCCDLTEIDVSDLPLMYKALYFTDFRDQLVYCGDDGSPLLEHVQKKVDKLRKWFGDHYPPKETNPDLPGIEYEKK